MRTSLTSKTLKRIIKETEANNKQESISENIKVKSSSEITLRRKLNTILNMFEQMGLDVKFGVAEEKYLRGFFYYIVTDYYDSFQYFIENSRRQQKNKSRESGELLFCYFE